MNIYNNDYLSLPQQVDKNKKDIEELKNQVPYPINWLGDWEETTGYKYCDGVSYNGSSYIFKVKDLVLISATSPDLDTEHWQLFAEKGEQGATGPQGPQGEQGVAGANGTDGKDTLLYTFIPTLNFDPSQSSTHSSNYLLTRFSRTPILGEYFQMVVFNSYDNKVYIGRAQIINITTTEANIRFSTSNQVTQCITGPAGSNGTNGVGVPAGGTAGQYLAKIDGTDYNTQWVTPSGGGGSSLYQHNIRIIGESNQITSDINSRGYIYFTVFNNSPTELTLASIHNYLLDGVTYMATGVIKPDSETNKQVVMAIRSILNENTGYYELRVILALASGSAAPFLDSATVARSITDNVVQIL